jgi:hypothetical protein
MSDNPVEKERHPEMKGEATDRENGVKIVEHSFCLLRSRLNISDLVSLRWICESRTVLLFKLSILLILIPPAFTSACMYN